MCNLIRCHQTKINQTKSSKAKEIILNKNNRIGYLAGDKGINNTRLYKITLDIDNCSGGIGYHVLILHGHEARIFRNNFRMIYFFYICRYC